MGKGSHLLCIDILSHENICESSQKPSAQQIVLQDLALRTEGKVETVVRAPVSDGQIFQQRLAHDRDCAAANNFAHNLNESILVQKCVEERMAAHADKLIPIVDGSGEIFSGGLIVAVV